ncbi:MAG TPA: hypothetical protein VFD59_14175 [Nocardioidaceae bacterium]|nr:hypothetical protein [Nocardioidaceae bacterium]
MRAPTRSRRAVLAVVASACAKDVGWGAEEGTAPASARAAGATQAEAEESAAATDASYLEEELDATVVEELDATVVVENQPRHRRAAGGQQRSRLASTSGS